MDSLRQIFFSSSDCGSLPVKSFVDVLDPFLSLYQDWQHINVQMELSKKICNKFFSDNKPLTAPLTVEISKEDFNALEILPESGLSLHPAFQDFTFDTILLENGNVELIVKEGYYQFSGWSYFEKYSSFISSTFCSLLKASFVIPIGLVGLGWKTIYNSQTSSKVSDFFISEIQKHEMPEVIKTMRIWRTFAENKAEVNGDQQEIFKSSSMISGKVAIKCIKESTLDEKIYACRDSYGFFQGVIVLDENQENLHVEHLLSSPHNVKSLENNQNSYQVRGVGTALLNFAVERGISLNKKKIELISLESSRDFYLKYGFPKRNNKIYDYNDKVYYPMELDLKTDNFYQR